MKRYACTPQQPPWVGNRYAQSTFKTKVYEVIKSTGDVGANRREIADKTNLNVGRVSSYLAELKREGYVKRLGDAIDPNSLSAEESILYAITSLENALVTNAKKKGVTPELEKAFARYNKIKSLALGAKTTHEESSAFRMAIIDLVKMVF